MAEAHPLMFGALLSTVKTSAADCLVQFGVEGKSFEEWDVKRTLTFATFGFGFMGVAQFFLIGRLPLYIFPSIGTYAAKPLRQKAVDFVGTRNLCLQVAWDQLVVMPTLFLTVYYSIKSLVHAAPEATIGESISVALRKWRTNFWEDVETCWAIWIPAQLINFGLVPLHFRIPFVALVSTAYTATLSCMRGEDEVVVSTNKVDEAKAVTSKPKQAVGESLEWRSGQLAGFSSCRELRLDGFNPAWIVPSTC